MKLNKVFSNLYFGKIVALLLNTIMVEKYVLMMIEE